MKKGISLIVIIIMFFTVIVLGMVCAYIFSNNFSFFNIKEYKDIKAQIQSKVNDTIFSYELNMGRNMKIEPGYILGGDENSYPVISSAEYSYVLSNSDIYEGIESLENVKIYLDEKGIVHLKYMFLDI